MSTPALTAGTDYWVRFSGYSSGTHPWIHIRTTGTTGGTPPGGTPPPTPPPPPQGTTPPTLETATVDGSSLTLTFDEALSTTAAPAARRFRVSGTDARTTVTGVAFRSPPGSTEVELTLRPAVVHGDSGITVSYRQGNDANPLQDRHGNEVADFSGLTVSNDTPALTHLAPYWHGTGGFAVRPADGDSAIVRLNCGGRRYATREHAGEDGLIVRTVNRPACTAEDGRPIEGELTFEGIDGDGWYWVNGIRNVAVAPLVHESQLNPLLRPPVPGGVAVRPSGDRRFLLEVVGRWYGTLMVHDESGFMGIIPHVRDLEGAGEHVAPYWKGGGGIVGRPLDGESAEVRLACGEADAETRALTAGEDGLIVELLPGCFDEEGAALRGRLEADGLEDGAWYWINTGTASAAVPLVRRATDVDLTVPVLPGGVEIEEGPLGTLFSRGPLLGVVPRLERIEP